MNAFYKLIDLISVLGIPCEIEVNRPMIIKDKKYLCVKVLVLNPKYWRSFNNFIGSINEKLLEKDQLTVSAVYNLSKECSPGEYYHVFLTSDLIPEEDLGNYIGLESDLWKEA